MMNDQDMFGKYHGTVEIYRNVICHVGYFSKCTAEVLLQEKNYIALPKAGFFYTFKRISLNLGVQIWEGDTGEVITILRQKHFSRVSNITRAGEEIKDFQNLPNLPNLQEKMFYTKYQKLR